MKREFIICWIIMMSVITIDLITTVVGLELGGMELNPIAAYFFSFGILGYLMQWMLAGILIFAVLLFPKFACSFLYKKLSGEEMGKNLTIFLYCLLTVVFVFLETLVIINNIGVIIRLA